MVSKVNNDAKLVPISSLANHGHYQLRLDLTLDDERRSLSYETITVDETLSMSLVNFKSDPQYEMENLFEAADPLPVAQLFRQPG